MNKFSFIFNKFYGIKIEFSNHPIKETDITIDYKNYIIITYKFFWITKTIQIKII